jgi:hypothetical protein
MRAQRPFSVRQWLKDYGALAALVGMALGLGVPGLYHLGDVSEQLRRLHAAVREDVAPELRALRAGMSALLAELGGTGE